MSLYESLGGAQALDAALDLFYEKVLADSRINGYFDDVDMGGLKKKGQAFLTMAFGGPNEYHGDGLRVAHAGVRSKGMDEGDFETFMGHFRATLEELGAGDEHVSEVMSIAYSAKDDVLGR